MIDNLLVFSRIARKQVSIAEVNMKHLVEQVIADLKQPEQTLNTVVLIKDLLNTRADRNMLRQVFINLISNAFKYTGRKEHAVIEIGSQRENSHNIYYVKDNGAGFSMKLYDKLFGVFQRLHNSNEFD